MTTSAKLLLASKATLIAAVVHGTALAQTFGDIPSESDGFAPGTGAQGIRDAILKVFKTVLSFLALAAVIVIVIAGIRLIVSQGEEEQKNTAKKTILYAVIGLILVLAARVIVSFLISLPSGA